MNQQLPQPDEPLRLADGTMIGPDGSPIRQKRERFVEVPSNTEAKKITAARKTLAELPAPPSQLNPVSIIVFYKLLGVSDDEIAVATGLAEDAVGRITMSKLFTEVRDNIVAAILENDADDVRTLFAQNARNLAERLVELADSEDEKVALGAVNSGLDRAGLRPADVVEHRHRVEGGLRIEYVDHTNNRDSAIAVEYEEID